MKGKGTPSRTISRIENVEGQRSRTNHPLRLDDLVPDGVADKLANGVELKFTHDVGAVSFRRLDADAEGHGNFLAALALGEQLHDFALARGQAATKNSHVIGH